jgi:hypothetical protein
MNPFRKNEKPAEPTGMSQPPPAPNRWMLVHDTLTDKILEIATGNIIAEGKMSMTPESKKALAELVEAANLGQRLMLTRADL